MLLKGYWEEAEYDEDYQSFDFDFLHNEYEGTELSAMDFLHGWCDVFACRLLKKYLKQGLNVEVVFLSGYEQRLIHAYVQIYENSKTYYVDIRGITDNEAQFLDEFEVTPRDEYCVWKYYNSLPKYKKRIKFEQIPKQVREAAKAFSLLPMYNFNKEELI